MTRPRTNVVMFGQCMLIGFDRPGKIPGDPEFRAHQRFDRDAGPLYFFCREMYKVVRRARSFRRRTGGLIRPPTIAARHEGKKETQQAYPPA